MRRHADHIRSRTVVDLPGPQSLSGDDWILDPTPFPPLTIDGSAAANVSAPNPPVLRRSTRSVLARASPDRYTLFITRMGEM